MSDTAYKPSFARRVILRWQLFLRAILHVWIKAQVLPDLDGRTGAEPGRRVCYVLDDYALSSVLILDRACQELGLARPLLPIPGLEATEKRSYAALRRLQGLILRHPSARRSSAVLRRLVEHFSEHPDEDIALVPVTVLVGRAPDKETGIAKVLFAEDWEVAGRFRRLVSTWINGRDTVVQFSRPISLQEMIAEGLGPGRTLRKVSRILRTHFRRVRTAVIGPDLSHRRTVVDGVLAAPAVRAAIRDKARRDKISEDRARSLARKYALEIAANYSYSFVRIAWFLLQWLVQKVFRTVHLHGFERFKRSALDHAIIYVPCHRSHADYILVSYLLYRQGLVSPHIAAGINLNLPLIGGLLRRGGAFYLRRSFRSQMLYSAVFSEYVSTILSRGTSVEYYIEGTRSRTGRLLPPKGGMLAMTVRSYLRQPTRPVMFQPVYIGYERLLEGASYTRELSGAKKKKESLVDLLRAFRILRNDYGAASVSFGEPIFLDAMLDAHSPDWRGQAHPLDEKPPWLTPMINELGDRILRAINAAADVNPVNLLATVLLATPRHALGEHELIEQLELYRSLLERGPLGGAITVTPRTAGEIIDYGLELGLLERRAHMLGDIIRLNPEHAIALTYFRNNVAHLFALPALIACCLLRGRCTPRAQLDGIARDVFPFLRTELTLPWEETDLPRLLQHNLDLLEASGLVTLLEDGRELQRGEGGSAEAARISLLARGLLPTLERFYITVAVLEKNGSGTLTREQLERLCILTAQRISLLQEFEAPEFYDRALFRQFIGDLKRLGVLVGNAENRLEFGQELERMGRDARLILDKDIRHSIIRVAPSLLEGEE